MRQIGINMGAVGGLSNGDYVRAIAELGFTATFTGVAPTEERQAAFAELFAKHGITYETLHAPFGHINDIWLAGEDGERMLGELLTCVDRCALVGAPIAVVHLSSGLTPPSVTDLGRARFTTLIEYAHKKGVILAFENQRKIFNLAWALETFGAQDSVAFCWDCGHEACFTPGRQYMPLFGDRLVCTHIHDNMGQFNQDQHLIPFDGVMDYRRFADHLRAVNYEGSLMLEVIERNSQKYVGLDSYAYLERAATAAKRLRELVDGE